MIYTGYYAKLKKYKEDGLYPIAISGRVPDFFSGDRYKDFAPRFRMFQKWKNKEISDLQYTTEYRQWLDSLDKEEIREELKDVLKEYNDIVLLCYEKPGDFCHRHILADWLEENMGVRVDEYSN